MVNWCEGPEVHHQTSHTVITPDTASAPICTPLSCLLPLAVIHIHFILDKYSVLHFELQDLLCSFYLYFHEGYSEIKCNSKVNAVICLKKNQTATQVFEATHTHIINAWSTVPHALTKQSLIKTFVLFLLQKMSLVKDSRASFFVWTTLVETYKHVVTKCDFSAMWWEIRVEVKALITAWLIEINWT